MITAISLHEKWCNWWFFSAVGLLHNICCCSVSVGRTLALAPQSATGGMKRRCRLIVSWNWTSRNSFFFPFFFFFFFLSAVSVNSVHEERKSFCVCVRVYVPLFYVWPALFSFLYWAESRTTCARRKTKEEEKKDWEEDDGTERERERKRKRKVSFLVALYPFRVLPGTDERSRNQSPARAHAKSQLGWIRTPRFFFSSFFFFFFFFI